MLSPVLLALAAIPVGALRQGDPGTVRLNSAFDESFIHGRVRDFRIHPSGNAVLFRADARKPEVMELYSALVDGSARPQPVVLLPADGTVHDFAFSPNGQWVVYRAEKDQGEVELYSHRVGTPGSRRLHGPLAGAVTDFELAPNGQRVTFIAEDEAGFPQLSQIYGVSIDGSQPPIRLDTPLSGHQVSMQAVAPGGGRVVFLANPQSVGFFELYSSPLDGHSPAVRLLPGSNERPSLATPAFSPDGVRLVFRFYSALYSVPTDGSSAAVRLDLPGAGPIAEAHVTPDGARVVFLVGVAGGPVDLCSVPIAGGVAPLVLASGTDALLGITDANLAVFRSGGELLRIALDGSAGSMLLASVGTSEIRAHEISPDGRHLVYSLGERFVNAFSLYSVPLDGTGAPERLDEAGSAEAGPWFVISPDSQEVVYAGFSGAEVTTFHLADIRSVGDPVAIAVDKSPRLATDSFALTPDGERLLFLDRMPAEGGVHLQSAPVQAGSICNQLSRELAPSSLGQVGRTSLLDPTGQRVVFTAEVGVSGYSELFSNSVSGGVALALSGQGNAFDPAVTQDGQHVVYRFDPRRDGDDPTELFSTRLDGTESPLRLASDPELGAFALSPDGAWVAFEASVGLQSVQRSGGSVRLLDDAVIRQFFMPAGSDACVYVRPDGLFRVPLSGRAAPQRLVPTTVAQATLTPDGAAVLFVGWGNLYLVAADGSSPSVRLSTLASIRDLTPSPDGEWVAFLHGNRVGAARLDGSGSHSLLDPLAPGLGVELLKVSPDSSRVVYVAEALDHEVFELFSAPIDGSSAPVRLSAPMTEGGDVVAKPEAIAITPDSTHVVYLADQEQDAVYDLFCVPMDGSSAPIQLSRATRRGSLDVPLRITADSRHAVFAADHTSVRFDLWQVPLDGSHVPFRLTEPLASPGCVGSLNLTLDSERVIYQAYLRFQSLELFSTSLPEFPQQRHARKR
jgi:Tol biopolymer transport system component